MLWSHRACQGAKKKRKKKGKDKRQHLSHCLSYVFCVFFSVASQWSPLMGCEFLRPHYCQRGERRKKEIPALCLDTVLFVFCRRSLSFLFVVLFRWSVCSTHFNRLMFTRGGGGGGGGGAGAGCCDIHASVVWVSSFFLTTASVFFFDILFLYFCYCCWKKKKRKMTDHNLQTCILQMWYWPYCARFRSTRRPETLFDSFPVSATDPPLLSDTPRAQDAKRQSFSAIYWT